MSKVILISIKPEFVEKIFNGEKTIELRKCKPSAKMDDLVIIYCTQPIKAIVGVCKIENILELSPEYLWNKYSKNLGVTEKQYWDYYENNQKAIGIFLKEVSQLVDNVPLKNIKSIYPTFSPPQTFKYFSKQSFLHLFKQITRIQDK
jgi:predicted transcriptional regulator